MTQDKIKCEHQWTEDSLDCVHCGETRVTTMKKLVPPKKVKVIYIADEVNSEFDTVIEQTLLYSGLKMVGSGYRFETKERDLGFEFSEAEYNPDTK